MVSEKQIISLKEELKDDNFAVEYEVVPVFSSSDLKSTLKTEILDGISDIDRRVELIDNEVAKINSEIERYINNADWLDYTVAVASGILCGMIDSFFVGEFSLKNENGDWKSSEKINGFVIKAAQKNGYKGDDLQGAIKYLEDNFHIASDPNLNDFGGGLQHHLRDFAHHPTPVGLFFSLLTQFTSKCYGTNTAGAFIITPVKDLTLIGRNLPEKFTFGVINWVFHMISDMAGSHATVGAGTGLPGPIVSLLKEISSLPFFQIFKNSDGKAKFSVWISKLFNGTLFAERDSNNKIIRESVKNFDLRAELSLFSEITRQAVPVVINECVVRAFYFIRRFAQECKRKNIRSISDLSKIDYQKILPFKNRTIVRMLTISTGTFTTIDLADATIRSAVKNAGQVASPIFWKDFVLRVNFVGVGRFAIAIGTDVGMGMKKSALENKRMILMSEQIELLNARVFYYQANMWLEIGSTEKSLENLEKYIDYSATVFTDSFLHIEESIRNIGNYIPEIEKKNPGFTKQLLDAMW